jgi:hypothetical protein
MSASWTTVRPLPRLTNRTALRPVDTRHGRLPFQLAAPMAAPMAASLLALLLLRLAASAPAEGTDAVSLLWKHILSATNGILVRLSNQPRLLIVCDCIN